MNIKMEMLQPKIPKWTMVPINIIKRELLWIEPFPPINNRIRVSSLFSLKYSKRN